jgi:hypothetical protein
VRQWRNQGKSFCFLSAFAPKLLIQQYLCYVCFCPCALRNLARFNQWITSYHIIDNSIIQAGKKEKYQECDWLKITTCHPETVRVHCPEMGVSVNGGKYAFMFPGRCPKCAADVWKVFVALFETENFQSRNRSQNLM